MTPYKKLSGNSGVTHYEAANDSIKIKFNNGSVYLYTNAVTGEDHIWKMKQLAASGKGLSTYVSQYVKDKYALKLR